MSRTVLLAHHLESMWEEGLKSFGTSFEDCVRNIMDYIIFSGRKIDEVIVTRFEDSRWEDEHYPLIELCGRMGIDISIREYAYAFRRDPDEDEDAFDIYPEDELNLTWCYGNRPHHTESDILEIEAWHHELKNDHVLLCGAFEDECLNDKQKILEVLDISYEKINELCVGTGVSYKLLAEERLVDNMKHHQDALDSLTEEIDERLDSLEIRNLIELAIGYPKLAGDYLERYLGIIEAYKDEVFENYNIDDIEIIFEYLPTTSHFELQEAYEAKLESEVSEIEDTINKNLPKEDLRVSESYSP